jgi:hypothetical protein
VLEALNDLFGIVFSRWDSTEALSIPTNADFVEAMSGALFRFTLAAKEQQGLQTMPETGRITAVADPMDLFFQLFVETTLNATFVPAQGMPPRDPHRFHRGSSDVRQQGSTNGGRP